MVGEVRGADDALLDLVDLLVRFETPLPTLLHLPAAFSRRQMPRIY
jgi:hypothetical protein